jgi:16S rRNA (guanine527-N7)-methyltransferase
VGTRTAQADAGFFVDRYLAETGEKARGKFKKLAALHEKYRKRARLSASLPAEAYVVHLVLDSLKLLELAPPGPAERLADVGSGGGYPGLPLAIVREDLEITLIEPSPHKSEYLRLAAAEMGLENVAVAAKPAEELAGSDVDVACAKAFAQPAVALRMSLPLVKAGGRVVLFLGDVAEERLADLDAEARAAGGRLANIHKYNLPTLTKPRALVEVIRD